MDHEILYRPSFSLLKVTLSPGETVSAEAGAMVSMSSAIELETSAKGGLFGALKRSVLGGESFFVNTFKASRGPGEVTFAPTLPGDITGLELRGQTLYAQSGAYIASSPDVQVDTKWGGAKTFFSREGFFLLKISGAGHVFLSSYGAIHEVQLKAGEKYIVDTGHMVAFDEGVDYAVRRVGGLKSTLFGGEGLVCELTGPGRIMIQTRNVDSFLSWLIPMLPKSQ
ncbi:MAG: TIGR00266 family protein [Candidatus Latescibacteria bacterium]|nr:TIGR00266 family protein [Candidatus Latescibacterota bacterium]